MTVPPGRSSASFPVRVLHAHEGDAQVRLSASYGRRTSSAGLTLTPKEPRSLEESPPRLLGHPHYMPAHGHGDAPALDPPRSDASPPDPSSPPDGPAFRRLRDTATSGRSRVRRCRFGKLNDWKGSQSMTTIKPAIHLVRFLVLCAAVAPFTGCTTLTDALFGDVVEVDPPDATPPEVRILVADGYVRRPDPGDFVVTDEDATAVTTSSVHFAVIADDPEGVRFVELLDITIEPTCARTPEGDPPPVPSFSAAPAVVVSGDRIDVPLSSERATTRIPLFRYLNLYGGSRGDSAWCPEDRPLLGNATASFRAQAGNFSDGVTRTAVATLTLIGSGGAGTGPVIGTGGTGGGGSCAGEGDPCRVHPAECFGRGESWQIPGTVQCRSGEPVCVAEAGEDYCTICGGVCGGCAGHSCSAENLCAPGAVCGTVHEPGGTVQRCQSLLVPESSTGGVPCTQINGFCWVPEEVGQAELGCEEGLI